MIRVLGRLSSINVRKVLWTCDELGLSYSREDWGSGFASPKAPEFLALNPNAQVPVIADDEGVLWESNTICRYLVGKHGRTDLLPVAPRQRALVERWLDWQAADLNLVWRYPFLALTRNDPPVPDPARIEADTKAWNGKMLVLEAHLATSGDFAEAGHFTLADIALGLSINRWLRTPIVHPETPAILAYYARLQTRPGCVAHGGPATP